MTFKIPINFQI